MFSLSASPIGSSSTRLVRSEVKIRRPIRHIRHAALGLGPLRIEAPTFGRRKQRSQNFICSAESQTQTVTRESSTITIAPIQGKEKSPDLDDGGDGFPPRDDGDGGGGGGGGGGWSGGFFFFGFLALLGLLKDSDEEGPYGDR